MVAHQPKRGSNAARMELAAPGSPPASSTSPHTPRGRLVRRIFRHKLLSAGLILFGGILFIALTAPLLAPHTAEQKFVPLEPPSRLYLFGTDDFGRDLLSRVLYGAGLSLQIAVSVVVVSGLAGTALGSASGYVKKLDNPIMRVIDALMAFPAVLLALGIGAMLGPSEVNVIIALAVVYTPGTARIVRASVLVVRERLYVEAAVAFGASHWRVLLKHILPNSLAPLIVQLTFVFAYAVLAEAILSFLGVGPPPPAPTWGNIISEGRDYITIAPWIAFFPGVFIAMTVLGLNLLGDGFRDVIDPRMVAE